MRVGPKRGLKVSASTNMRRELKDRGEKYTKITTERVAKLQGN